MTDPGALRALDPEGHGGPPWSLDSPLVAGGRLVEESLIGDLRMRERELQPASFLTLEPGTSVVDRFGQTVGEVQRVLLHEDGAFDGIIVRTRVGRRFVDAPDVRRISQGAVTLGITIVEVEHPAADAHGRQGAPAARYGRTAVTEADRDAVIDALKRAYVRDDLTIAELGGRVTIAHLAETLEHLDAALDDLTSDY